jgi:hypothetical protein
VSASLERRCVSTLSCSIVMSLTFACHEALLHFPDEVQHIWRYAHPHLFPSILTTSRKPNWSPTKWVYLFVRYVPLLFQVCVEYFHQSPPLSSHRSQRHPPRGSDSRLAKLQGVVHSGGLLYAGHHFCRRRHPHAARQVRDPALVTAPSHASAQYMHCTRTGGGSAISWLPCSYGSRA